jgi:hypothetical protein
MDKTYFVKVLIEYGIKLSATSKSDAIEMVKDIFAQDHNLELTDKEIIEVSLGDEGNYYEQS